MSSIKEATQQFMGQWLTREKLLYDELQSCGCSGLWLAELVRYFGLGWNFLEKDQEQKTKKKQKSKLDGKRFRKFVGVVEEAANSTKRVEAIDGLAAALKGLGGNGHFQSAASKIMWMYDRDNVAIFDDRVRTALDRMRAPKEVLMPSRDYGEFLARWKARYARVSTEIKAVCKKEYELAGHEEYQQEWFRRRVFDIWLWDAGG